MENKDKSVHFELLKMAKEIVVNEYIDKRAQDHNRWLAESEIAWKYRRIRLPYPTIPPYPTEKDIVARAKVLYEFLENKDPSNTSPPPTVTSLEPISEKDNVLVSTPPKEVASPEPIPIPVAESFDNLTVNLQEPTVIDLPVQSAEPVVPPVEEPVVPPVEEPTPQIEEPAQVVSSTSTTATSTSTATVSVTEQKPFGVSVDEITELARIKVQNDLNEDTTTVGRLLPSFLRKLEEMKRML